MNNQESLTYVRKYFDELFDKRNVDALDEYLDPDYFDDDIGDPAMDHIKNSKEYLKELFIKQPTIGVEVFDAIERDNVISAYLEWYVLENDKKRTIRKGVAIFCLRNQRIFKRHTFIYYAG
jgi:hypothetical protein